MIVNHRSVDAEQVHKWLSTGISVFDVADTPDVDTSLGYEGIAW